MPVISRKQKEIADRHAVFLDVALEIFVSDGYQQFNMNKIAEMAEYSKGTVYQHFHCKEEVLIQLCNQGMVDLSQLFKQAKQFEGSHRERMLAIFLAQDLYHKLNPKKQDLMQTLCADGIREKVSEKSLLRHQSLEAGLIGQVAAVVQDALKSGDLPPLQHFDPYELVFGLWSLGHGGQVLLSFNLPLEKLGIKNAQNALLSTMFAILDGLNWRPLTSEFDYHNARTRICEAVFAEELQQLGKDIANQ